LELTIQTLALTPEEKRSEELWNSFPAESIIEVSRMFEVYVDHGEKLWERIEKPGKSQPHK